MKLLLTIDQWVANLLRFVVVGGMVGLLTLIVLTVASRTLPILAIPGWEEIVELLFAWLVFLGALAHFRMWTMFSVTALPDALGESWRRYLRIVVAALILCLAGVMTVWGWRFAWETPEVTPVLSLPRTAWFAAIPVAGAGMVVYACVHLYRDLRGSGAATSSHAEAAGLS
jgi:TRAP-type C4-dicarboxylate transport system permease small subunit